MGSESVAAFARRYGDAWANPNTDVFVAMFTEDATYRDDQLGCFSSGHADLRAFRAHFVSAIS